MAAIIILAVFLAFSALPGHAQVVDGIAAVVNGRILTKSDIDRELLLYGGDTSDKELRKQAQETLIERYILEERAQKMKLDVADKEIAATIENIRKQYRLELPQFKEAVTRQGVTWEGYISGVRNEILRMKVFGATMGQELQLDDERLKAYYLKNAESFRQPQKVRLIGAATPKGSRQAELVRDKVSKGADFKAAVKDVTGDDPYDTGLMAEEGLNDAFRMAVGPARLGDVTGPVDTGDAEHVILVAERVPGSILPFEQVKEKVRERFTSEGEQELYRSWIEQLKRKANIQRMQ